MPTPNSVAVDDAVVVVDLSLEMVMHEFFEPARRSAAVLAQHIGTHPDHELLGAVGLAQEVRLLEPNELSEVDWDFMYGKDLAGAITTAAGLLPQPGRVIMFSDFEVSIRGGSTFDDAPPLVEAAMTSLQEATSGARVIDAFAFPTWVGSPTADILVAIAGAGGTVQNVNGDNVDAAVKDYLRQHWT